MNIDASNFIGLILGETYELRELLGRGGMGFVFRAYEQSLKRPVAVKILLPQLIYDNTFLARFSREAETSANLEHSNIVPIYRYGIENNMSYVVMRLLEGGTLSQWVHKESSNPTTLLPVDEITQLLRQLASALDYAHSRGVVHRDIKPSNVMFDSQGTAYLVDFGIAKLLQDKFDATQLTATGHTMGTPAYMPPEQWEGGELVPATDQYALACVIYELLTGKPPFEARTPMALMAKHFQELPPPAHPARQELSEAIDGVLIKALAKNPNDRFPTAMAFFRAFSSAIDSAHKSIPVVASPPPPVELPPVVEAQPVIETPASLSEPVLMIDKQTPPSGIQQAAVETPVTPEIASAEIESSNSPLPTPVAGESDAQDSGRTVYPANFQPPTPAAVGTDALNSSTLGTQSSIRRETKPLYATGGALLKDPPSYQPEPAKKGIKRFAVPLVLAGAAGLVVLFIVASQANRSNPPQIISVPTNTATAVAATATAVVTPRPTQVVFIVSDDEQEAIDAYASGDAHVDNGEYEEAIEDFNRAIEISPNLQPAYLQRGAAYIQTGDYQEAVDDLSRALELGTDSASLRYLRGSAYLLLHDYNEAVDDFSQTIEREPENAEAYAFRGASYFEIGNYQEAVEDLSQAVELDPENIMAYEMRAAAYISLREFEQAIEDYDHTLELGRESAELYTNRGSALHEIGEDDIAVESFNRAIELDPDYANAYFNRSLSYVSLGDYEQAIDDNSRVVELNPTYAGAYANRGFAYALLEDYQEAIADYDRALELDAELTKVYHDRGLAYFRLEAYEQAVEDFSRAIEFDPSFAQAYANRGGAYYNLDNTMQALEDWRTAEALGYHLSASMQTAKDALEEQFGEPTPTP